MTLSVLKCFSINFVLKRFSVYTGNFLCYYLIMNEINNIKNERSEMTVVCWIGSVALTALAVGAPQEYSRGIMLFALLSTTCGIINFRLWREKRYGTRHIFTK